MYTLPRIIGARRFLYESREMRISGRKENDYFYTSLERAVRVQHIAKLYFRAVNKELERGTFLTRAGAHGLGYIYRRLLLWIARVPNCKYRKMKKVT